MRSTSNWIPNHQYRYARQRQTVPSSVPGVDGVVYRADYRTRRSFEASSVGVFSSLRIISFSSPYNALLHCGFSASRSTTCHDSRQDFRHCCRIGPAVARSVGLSTLSGGVGAAISFEDKAKMRRVPTSTIFQWPWWYACCAPHV